MEEQALNKYNRKATPGDDDAEICVINTDALGTQIVMGIALNMFRRAVMECAYTTLDMHPKKDGTNEERAMAVHQLASLLIQQQLEAISAQMDQHLPVWRDMANRCAHATYCEDCKPDMDECHDNWNREVSSH